MHDSFWPNFQNLCSPSEKVVKNWHRGSNKTPQQCERRTADKIKCIILIKTLIYNEFRVSYKNPLNKLNKSYFYLINMNCQIWFFRIFAYDRGLLERGTFINYKENADVGLVIFKIFCFSEYWRKFPIFISEEHMQPPGPPKHSLSFITKSFFF